MTMTWYTRLLQHARAMLLPLALLAASSAGVAQQVQRCESADGKVTYSNTKCPEGTTPVRSVNTSPPVAVDEQKAAKERARRDAAEVKAIDKARAKDEEQEQRAAAEQKKAQAKERERCDKAKRELEKAKDARAELHRRPATIQQMQKSDGEIAKREAEVARACPG